jgi:hypothetical protein
MPSLASQFAARTAILVAVAALSWAAPGRPQAAGAPATQPVVVELFTSQGCSSCPPADAVLGELAERDDVIALSLHVDYWDYIGWKDPYSSPQMTERQRAYAEELALRYVYTPQMVIDGRQDIVGSRRSEVMTAVETAAKRGKPVEIAFDTHAGGRVIIPEGQAPDRGATIWLAVYDEGHETQIKRGENAGRTIRNAHVVRRLERLGTWMGERLEIPLNLDSAALRDNYGCAVILQQGRTGPVLGAGMMRLETLAN